MKFAVARVDSLQPGRISRMLIIAAASLCAGTLGHLYFPFTTPQTLTQVYETLPSVEDIAQNESVAAVANAAEQVHNFTKSALSAKPEAVTREVELISGQSFTEMLTGSDISLEDANAAATALASVYKNKKIKTGLEFTLNFTRTGADEVFNGLTFQAEPTLEIGITRGADGLFTAVATKTPIERQRFAAKGTIRSSLYNAGEAAGVPRGIMAAMLRAYAHNVDFQRDIHPGDQFEVLYDQPMSKDGKAAGQAVIVYAALNISGKLKQLYRVTFGDGTVDYFDEKGQSVKRALLRTPVEGARVTSGFGMRMHPILGYSKMHQGIDFGAAYGAPIYSAGGGVVVEAGFKGGYGRYVRVRHNNTIETAYAHMSRFARGLYVGERVSQGEVIGYVGASGRATGAHLHYEVHINKKPVNPLSVAMPTGRTLEGKVLAQFKDGQKKIQGEFASILDKTGQVEPIDPSSPPLPSNKPEFSQIVADNVR